MEFYYECFVSSILDTVDEWKISILWSVADFADIKLSFLRKRYYKILRREIKNYDNEIGRITEITCISVTRSPMGEGKIDCEATERCAFYFQCTRRSNHFLRAALLLPRDKLFEIPGRERERVDLAS